MKYSELIKPLGIDTEQAGFMFGRKSLFEKVVNLGWIKPVVDRHSCKLYDIREVEACWERLRAEGLPDDKK